MRVLNIGSLNIDLVYRVPHIVHPGETIASTGTARYAGGKGLNQSIALARAGAEVFHAGAIGQDGLFLKEMLEKENVDCSALAILPGTPTGCALIQVADDGENAIVLYGGANQKITLADVIGALDRMKEGEIVLLQNEISGLPEIFKAAAERKLRIFFNPSPMKEELAALPLELADTLLVNEEESAILTHLAPQKIEKINLLTTKGSKGAEYRSKTGDTIQVPAVRAEKVVDTTGAGDTFTGFFIAALCCGKSTETAMREAAAAAAIAVSRPGAAGAIPYAKEIQRCS